jgi:hypothetical protein
MYDKFNDSCTITPSIEYIVAQKGTYKGVMGNSADPMTVNLDSFRTYTDSLFLDKLSLSATTYNGHKMIL